MGQVRIENRRRTVWHFTVDSFEESPAYGKVKVERYRVVLGDSADSEMLDADTGRSIEHVFELPDDAWDRGWQPSTPLEKQAPAPVVLMTIEQYEDEVFPEGSRNRLLLDSLVARNDVRVDISGRRSRPRKAAATAEV